MQIFSCLDGKFISYSDGKAVVLDKAELTKQLEFSIAQLAQLPKPLTDKQYTDWGKLNYPTSSFEQSRTLIQAEITKLTETLELCK